jgi:hypothetical protein
MGGIVQCLGQVVDCHRSGLKKSRSRDPTMRAPQALASANDPDDFWNQSNSNGAFAES